MSKPTIFDLLQHQREVIDQTSRVETQLAKLERLGVNIEPTRRALKSASNNKIVALGDQARTTR
jgi:hypothetical protein